MATITGTLANDTLFGTSDTSEQIYGLDGDDIITSGSGKWSHLYGGLGNDRLISGYNINNLSRTAKDYFEGGEGDDTYVYNINSIAMNIRENDFNSGFDTLEFGIGIEMQDLYINMGADGSSEIRYTPTWYNDPDISIMGSSGGTSGLERFIFSDGSTYTISENLLTASDDDNLIYMARGAYILDAGGGNDIIHGTQQGGPYGNSDTIHGGAGNDTIYGHGGGDVLYGGAGNDYLHAGTGQFSDLLYGGDGDDIIIGGNAYTGGYNTHSYGGAGNDIIHINGYSGEAYGDNGSDEMHHNYLVDQNTAHVLGRNIQLRGGLDNDVYIINKNDTTNTISRKTHIIDEAGSFDTIFLNGDWDINAIILQYGGIGLEPNGSVYNVAQINPSFPEHNNYIERIVFSNGDIYSYDQLTSSMSQITATSGDDTIYLSAWHDEFYALGGNDTIYALERDDIVDGGAGDDTLYGEHGNDTLIGGSGNDTLDGGIGNDTISYASAAAGTLVKLGSNFTFDDGDGGTDTLSSIENIIGSAYNDDLRGNNDVNIIEGGDGDDNIYGYFGDDILYGGAGDDFLTGAEDNDTLYGDAGADEIYGGLGNDTIHGGDGDDAKLDGGDGSDIINGDAGNDTLYGRAGDDTLNGGDGNDVIYAEDGNDILNGGDGDDFMMGYDGNDTLNGGLGYDRLYGNAGADTFVFTDYSQYTSIYDIVHDFNATDGDVLDISDLISAYDPLTESLSDYVWVSHNTVRSYIYIDNDGTGTNASMEYSIRMDGVFWDDTDMATLITNGTVIV